MISMLKVLALLALVALAGVSFYEKSGLFKVRWYLVLESRIGIVAIPQSSIGDCAKNADYYNVKINRNGTYTATCIEGVR